MKLQIIILTSLLIILIYISKSYESMNLYSMKNTYKDYNNDIFNLQQYITEQENKFIIKWLSKLDKNDYKFKNISSYCIEFTINIDGTINNSRFAIGTLTKFDEFKIDCIKLMKYLKIDPIKLSNTFTYYGIAWDIQNNLFKIYLINELKNRIKCYEYKINRYKQTIVNTSFSLIKNYYVKSKYTVMYKNGATIYQINSDKLPLQILNKYKKSKNIITDMEQKGWLLDTYSEYNNKLNLYFEEII